MTSPALADVLALVERGLAVLPLCGVDERGRCGCGRSSCTLPGKHPLTKHGYRDASTDPDQVRLWWRTHENANVGIRTGGTLAVLEVEPAGRETLKRLATEHPKFTTWTVQAGGDGLKFFFRAKGDVPTRSAVFPGIHFKAADGFVVAPPSRNASGRHYTWATGRRPEDVELQPLPEWLREAVLRPAPRPSTNSGAVPEGGRNTHLASVAGAARRRGLGGTQLLDVLLDENAKRCTPPLDRTEVERIAASISRYPAGPRTSRCSNGRVRMH